MAETKHSLKVFLCHAHADAAAVHALYVRLTKDGVDVWLDKEKLLPGQDWELEIKKAVRESDVIVVCLSKQFNQAGFRQKEVRLALDTAMEKPEGEIFIIPARLEECETLESLRKWQWVDLFEVDGYEMLMRAMRARAEKIGAVLQAQRNWLSPITYPRLTQYRPVIAKNLVANEEKTATKSEPIELHKHKIPKSSLKISTPVVIAIIGAAATIIAAIIGIVPLLLKPSSIPIATALIQAPISTSTALVQVPLSTFSTLPPSETPFPSLIPTESIAMTPASASSGRPATYTMQIGEFTYCIARRFNVNPDDLDAINNIPDGGLFYPGRTLTIPQSGFFPGDRSLHTHPDIYIVDSNVATIYGVACYYGDVDPSAIASANDISVSAKLSFGQKLVIP